MTMPNPAELLKLLSKLPKGSKAAQELVAADVAAREAAQKALYAGHTPPTETGRKAIAQAKQTLITPEQQAKLEAEMREKGKKKFLKPSKEKDRWYHGTGENITQFDPDLSYQDVNATFLTKKDRGVQHHSAECHKETCRVSRIKGPCLPAVH